MAEINGGKLSDLEQAAQSCHIASVKSRKQRVSQSSSISALHIDRRKTHELRLELRDHVRLLITITRSNFRDINNNKRRPQNFYFPLKDFRSFCTLFPCASRVDRRFLIGGCFIHPSISLLLNRFNEQLTRYAPFLLVNKRSKTRSNKRSFVLLF